MEDILPFLSAREASLFGGPIHSLHIQQNLVPSLAHGVSLDTKWGERFSKILMLYRQSKSVLGDGEYMLHIGQLASKKSSSLVSERGPWTPNGTSRKAVKKP